MSPDCSALSNTDSFSTQDTTHDAQSSLLRGLSFEIRSQILEMVLQNKASPWADDEIDYGGAPIELQFPSFWQDRDYTNLCSFKTKIGNVNILRVCHQFYDEGRNILYGRNTFQAYHFPALAEYFPKVIGTSNSARIRKVIIGAPERLKSSMAPTERFLNFFADKMPGLTDLTLTTKFDPGYLSPSYAPSYRAILFTSAWMTCKHPQLTRAIWLGDSGGKRCPKDIREEHERQIDGSTGDLSESQGFNSKKLVMIELGVRILKDDQRFHFETHECVDMIPSIQLADEEDMVLDCHAIRRTRWNKLLDIHPRTFALPKSTISSEPKPPAMKQTKDGTTYLRYEDAFASFDDRFRFLTTDGFKNLRPASEAFRTATWERDQKGRKEAHDRWRAMKEAARARKRARRGLEAPAVPNHTDSLGW